MRYSEDGPPELRDWILKLNPNRGLNNSLRNRLWKKSRVRRTLREGKPSWEEAGRAEITPFFAELDVLFLYDRENQKEWFTKIVLKNAKRSPVCVDLLEMNRFFFSGQDLPNSEVLIKQFIPEATWKRNDPQLPYLVRSLGVVLQNIVSQIRSESQATPGHSLIYSLLGKALTENPPRTFQDFHALFQVAGIAHRILWGNELFAKPYGDKAPELIENTDAWSNLLIREIVATMPASAPAIQKFGEVKLNEIANALKLSPNTLEKYLEKIGPLKAPSGSRNKAVIEDKETYLKLLNALVADEEINTPNIVDPKYVHGTFERLFGKLPEETESEKTAERTKRKSGPKGELEGFLRRKEQDAFADFCIDAINRKGMYAIEADTGTGKTLGYLAPACEFARQTQNRIINDALCLMRKRMGQNGPGENQDKPVMPDANAKVIVATVTKNLQDQLLEKEWPRLTKGKTLYGDLKAAALKGKPNFLCITAVVSLFEDVYGPDPDETQSQGRKRSRNELAEMRLAWLFLFLILMHKEGKTENIPENLFQRFRDMNNFLDESKAEAACTRDLCQIGNCIKEKRLRGKGLHRSCTVVQCLIGNRLCIYPQHLQKAREADIVVTNHHKLAVMDDPMRESVHMCLIDEADQFPENLRSAATIALSSRQVQRDFLQRVAGSPKRQGFAQILSDGFAKKMGSSRKSVSNRKAFGKAHENAKSILATCENINFLLQCIGKISYQYPIDSSMRWKKMHLNAGEQFKKCLNELADCFDRIVIYWDAILCSGIYEEKMTKSESNEQDRIKKYKVFSEQWRDIARDIPKNYPSKNFVHVHTRKKLEWKLKKIPYDLSCILQKTIYPTTIFTSATLFVDKSISLFSENLGASFDECRTKRIASPFNYTNNVLGFVTKSLPAYNSNSNEKVMKQWRKKVACAIARFAVALNGRTLVLFTNTEEMENIFKQVRPILEKYGIDPLLQNGSSLAEINAFQSVQENVLFGVNRFWTGVDFPGSTLSQVIVVRAPNPYWSDPLVEHRKEHMSRDEFWEKYYRPTARLRLRQGFGRLIRKETDTGLFVALDRSLVRNNLNNAVPVTFDHRSTEPDEMNWLMDEGLKYLGLRTEFMRRNINLEEIKLGD